MHRDDLVDLNTFAIVAEEQSFTRAAAKLGTSQSALSHAMRRLEARLGVRLLTRTTRSVAPTVAGEQLLDTLRPAFESIGAQLATIGETRVKPAGAIRITTFEHAARTVLWPVLARFLPDFPDINVELSVDSGFTDIVAERFEAGVRLGEALAKDMNALRVGPDLRMAVVGSASYLAAHSAPGTPQELAGHRCINLRMPTSKGVYAWEFEKAGRDLRVRVEGQLTFNNTAMCIGAAEAGFGLAYVMEDQVQMHLKSGRLVRVLEQWCPSFSGYHLYYPSRRQPSAAFALLVDALRFRSGRG